VEQRSRHVGAGDAVACLAVLARRLSVRSRGPAPFKKSDAKGCNPDDFTSVHILSRHQSAIIRMFTDRELWAGRSPSIHGFLVRSLAGREPLEQIKRDSFNYRVAHQGPFFRASSID
jgi:hypothetical protein